MRKKYIDVEVMCSGGTVRPLRIHQEDGSILPVKRTLHTASPVDHEFEGIRYTVLIGSAEEYMYLDGKRLYVDPSFGNEDTS